MKKLMNKDDENKIIDSFFSQERAVHEFFGCEENLILLPLTDYREFYWARAIQGGDWRIIFSKKPLTEEMLAVGEFDDVPILTYDVKKSDYPKNNFTLICLDSQSDSSGKQLGIFDNSKNVKDAEKWTVDEPTE